MKSPILLACLAVFLLFIPCVTADSVSVKVEDKYGRPVSDVTVYLYFYTGGEDVFPMNNQTNSDGLTLFEYNLSHVYGIDYIADAHRESEIPLSEGSWNSIESYEYRTIIMDYYSKADPGEDRRDLSDLPSFALPVMAFIALLCLSILLFRRRV